MPHIGICYKISLRHIWLGHGTVTVPAGAFRRPTGATPRLLDRRQTVPYRILYSGESLFKAIPHNSKCRYGERGAADAKPRAQIILDAAKVSAASGGNSEPKQGQRSQSARGFCPPKHDAGTATRHYRAFWQRSCRAAAAGAVLKPQGGNCAVLPCIYSPRQAKKLS